ncbi:LptF/LptG family permease [Desulfonatronum sp. SC1]|uniref:LptF/LptG family permease n=1 Tax=Desulfonatronum sp. SC1 TaxID=2109626 RepID=UPI0013047CFC|nr:LptF/LptG family permease [Desulfonatronum sp. SC1]
MSSQNIKLPPPASPAVPILTDILRRLTRYRLNTLQRYLLVQNLFLIGFCLGVGICIYLLQDLVENLDIFVQAGVGVGTMVGYFLAKLPLILSQILPAAFLVSLIVQIGLLVRHRELLALQSGGVSYTALIRFFAVYGLVWCLAQLFLAQALGVAGQRAMDRIWREEVRKEEAGQVELRDIWFLSGAYVVSIDGAYPDQRRGRDINVYVYGEGNTLQRIIVASRFDILDTGWELHEPRIYETLTFEVRDEASLRLDISQDLEVFGVLQTRFEAAALSLFELGRIISYLEGTGSNVERLRTAWHMKWSYAFSLLMMALIALALYTIFDSVYLNIALGLVIVFVYHVLFVLGVSLGERGFLSPFIGAWMGNLLFGFLAGGRLLWYVLPDNPFEFLRGR